MGLPCLTIFVLKSFRARFPRPLKGGIGKDFSTKTAREDPNKEFPGWMFRNEYIEVVSEAPALQLRRLLLEAMGYEL